MKTSFKTASIFSIVISLSAITKEADAITFGFLFDSDPASGIQDPTIGSGSFTFANDPGDGTFAFSTLGSFSMNYSFLSGDSFSEADINSDLNLVSVLLSTSGSERRLKFSDTGLGGGGSFGGSLDFVNLGGAGLSFEPSYFGGDLSLYTEGSSLQNFGSYSATADPARVPDSYGSSLVLLATGVVGLAFARRSPAFTFAA